MAKETRTCYECKNKFQIKEMIQYASPRAKTMHWYCPKCLKDKQSRDNFADKVCQIFGLKNPGPRIWTERKRIIQTYGYTDETIIDCLDYIYRIEKYKKFTESICLVKPPMVEKMMQYKKLQQAKSINLARAINTQMNECIVPIKENKESYTIKYNPDDWI